MHLSFLHGRTELGFVVIHVLTTLCCQYVIGPSPLMIPISNKKTNDLRQILHSQIGLVIQGDPNYVAGKPRSASPTCRSWGQNAPLSVCQKGRRRHRLHHPLHRSRLSHKEHCCLTAAETAEKEEIMMEEKKAK